MPLDPPLDIGAAGGKLGCGRASAPRRVGSSGPSLATATSRRSGAPPTWDWPPRPPRRRPARLPSGFGGAIWMRYGDGSRCARASGRTLSRAAGLGAAVGSPAVAINDGVVIVAWADRPSSSDPWRMRWVRFKAVSRRESSRDVHPAGRRQGRAGDVPWPRRGSRWALPARVDRRTDRPPRRAGAHAVARRSATRQALDISNKSANAGQGQAAVNAARQGLVAFLESTDSGFRVVATAITCGP